MAGTFEYKHVDDQIYKFEVDDSQGCFAKFTYHGRAFWVGVNLSDTRSDTYPYAATNNIRHIQNDGISRYSISVGTWDAVVASGCRHTIDRMAHERELEKFDPERWCEELHKRVEELS